MYQQNVFIVISYFRNFPKRNADSSSGIGPVRVNKGKKKECQLRGGGSLQPVDSVTASKDSNDAETTVLPSRDCVTLQVICRIDASALVRSENHTSSVNLPDQNTSIAFM